MQFHKFLESKNTIVTISLGHYPEQLKNALDDLVDFSERESDRIDRFVYNPVRLQQLLQQVAYPQVDRVMMALAGKDPTRLRIVTKRFYDWAYQNIRKTYNPDWQQRQKEYDEERIAREVKREISSILNDYYSQIFAQDHRFTAQLADKQYEVLLNQSTEELKKIADVIQKAIDRIPDWNGSPVRVLPAGTDNYLEPLSGAEVFVGEDCMFTFLENPPNYEIDDVLDSGDTDFFTNPKTEADYFKLVQELRNPGNATKPGKILTLFTARPVKDRALYEKARQNLAMGIQATIPSRIFLTSNPDSAMGIASDLAGGSESRRDVWKIKIDSRYLIQTLEGRERQYQVVGDDFVPIKWIDFYSEGE